MNGFRMVPEQDELAALNREFAFFSADIARGNALSVEQIADFNRHGFILPLPVFSRDEMADVRLYFDRLLAKTLAAGQDSYSISSAHLTYGPVRDLLTHPRIVAYVADLLGEDVVAWGSHFFCKMPRDGKTVAWHQDASYWPLTPSKTVTVWLAIDEADVENACMQFISGSHRHGLLQFRDSAADEGNVLNQTIDRAENYGQVVNVELRAGEASVHSDLLLHGSLANHSRRRRCGLTLRYCAADVRAHLNWNEKGIVVRGADPTGHWRNPPRPSRTD